MPLRLIALVCIGIALSVAAPTSAESPDAASWTPVSVAAAIERKASQSSFAQLDRFGREAIASRRADRLQRIEHVAWLVLNQSDFLRFAFWNKVLRAEALRAGDHRYVQIADLDAIRSRYDQGGLAVEEQVEAVARTAPDWFVRTHAMILEAYFLIGRQQAAAALSLLAEAESPAIIADSAVAREGVWEMEGLALMRLKDLDGSARAFGRSQFEFGRPDYPRPDFDGVWDMAGLAASVGRLELASSLAAAHHRLVERSDLASLKPWDDDVCAVVAEAKDDPAGVVACLDPLGATMRHAQFIEPLVLPSRAIALARLGRIVEAQRDLAMLEHLRDAKRAPPATLERIPEVTAAILHAQGEDQQAFETLRRYQRDHDVAEAEGFSLGVGQLTGLMAKEMNIRQLQLATAQKNLVLDGRLVREQQLLTWAGGVLFLVLAMVLLWQLRISRQLRAARAEAEAGNRTKGEFLANMSHEIRTPLNGLLTMAELMERGSLPKEQRKRLAIVRSSGQDLLRLLNDILDFSKIEAGKLDLETVAFDIERLMEATLAGFAASAEEKGLQLWCEVAPSARGLREGDPARLRQIVCNFISNALKFTVKGGVSVELLGLGPDGREGLQLAVRDTGVGIPADKMELLFHKFSQVDASTTRRFGGTGLGLAICQELATLMGGRVWADSVLGEGSTFYATLRLPYLGEVIEAEPAHEEASETSAPPARPLRLLAAEDNPTNQVVLSTIMQIFGFELTLVGDGSQAVEAWVGGEFDAILMDVQMPVMDGVQATRTIRSAERSGGRRRTPIIALSANAFHHQVNEYLAAGMDAHVAKPIDLQALQATLESVLAPPESQAPPEADLALAV